MVIKWSFFSLKIKKKNVGKSSILLHRNSLQYYILQCYKNEVVGSMLAY